MSLTIKRILCPTDFSETAGRALEYACSLTEKFNAELHVLHVVRDFASEWPMYGEGTVFPGYLENIEEHAQNLEIAAFNQLGELLSHEWTAAHNVTFAVEHGKEFVEIVRFARELPADLIVIGTHGRGVIAHTLLGSIAEKVVQKASCPVLTVKPDGHQFELP
jgi:nucleotide-binding universal stress UspA family protein